MPRSLSDEMMAWEIHALRNLLTAVMVLLSSAARKDLAVAEVLPALREYREAFMVARARALMDPAFRNQRPPEIDADTDAQQRVATARAAHNQRLERSPPNA
jgi:hypothetical protein